MASNSPSKKVLRDLAKPFKNDKFNLLERTREALIGMRINEEGPYKKINILVEERPKLIEGYSDPDLDIVPIQLITLENDCVYILRTVRAWSMTYKPPYRADVRYLVFSTVCTPGNREIPDDYDDCTHCEVSSESEALVTAIKIVLLDRYDAWAEAKGEQARIDDEKLAAEYLEKGK